MTGHACTEEGGSTSNSQLWQSIAWAAVSHAFSTENAGLKRILPPSVTRIPPDLCQAS